MVSRTACWQASTPSQGSTPTYTDTDATTAESVEFLVGHQSTLFAWHVVIFLVFGVAIIPLARALHQRLGGGNELVGGMWILLVSVAAWGSKRLPKGLNVLGVISAAAGLITLIPGLSDVGMIFGLGSIAWFAWTGVVLLRGPSVTTPATEAAR